MSESMTGKAATLMHAISKAREMRKQMLKALDLHDELIDSLHAQVRAEMRKAQAPIASGTYAEIEAARKRQEEHDA